MPTQRLPDWVIPLALLVGALLFATHARAACDCASADPNQPCTSQQITYTSPTPDNWKSVTPDAAWCDGCNTSGAAVITVDFNCDGGDCTCGQYASGDYWVLPGADGKVHFTNRTPDETGSGSTLRNGTALNPAPGPLGFQCFDGRQGNVNICATQLGDTFDVVAGDALLFSVSFSEDWVSNGGGNHCGLHQPTGVVDNHGPCVHSAMAVMIEESWLPPTAFRPPFVNSAADYPGGVRPHYDTSALLMSELPGRPKTASAPADPSPHIRPHFAQDFNGDHSMVNQYLSPFANNGRSYANRRAERIEWMLTVMMQDYSAADLLLATTYVVQLGIDHSWMSHFGVHWSYGGHSMGRFITATMACAMLGDADLCQHLRDKCDPQVLEPGPGVAGCTPASWQVSWVRFRPEAGKVLWGAWDDDRLEGMQDIAYNCNANTYWTKVGGGGGHKMCENPNGLIDGGPTPGDSYQKQNSTDVWIGYCYAAHAMPIVGRNFVKPDLLRYCDRMMKYLQPPDWLGVAGGAHTRPRDPDPRAPASWDALHGGQPFLSAINPVVKELWDRDRACLPADCN